MADRNTIDVCNPVITAENYKQLSPQLSRLCPSSVSDRNTSHQSRVDHTGSLNPNSASCSKAQATLSEGTARDSISPNRLVVPQSTVDTRPVSVDSGYGGDESVINSGEGNAEEMKISPQDYENHTVSKIREISSDGHQTECDSSASVPRTAIWDEERSNAGNNEKGLETESEIERSSTTPDDAYQSFSTDSSLNVVLSNTGDDELNFSQHTNNFDFISPDNATDERSEAGLEGRENETFNIIAAGEETEGNRAVYEHERPTKSSRQNAEFVTSEMPVSKLENKSLPVKAKNRDGLQEIPSKQYKGESLQTDGDPEEGSVRDSSARSLNTEFRDTPRQHASSIATRRTLSDRTDSQAVYPTYRPDMNTKENTSWALEIISHLENKTKQLEVEISRLGKSQEKMQRRIQELLEVNKDWANYDVQREQYVQETLGKLSELETRCRKEAADKQQLSEEISRLISDNKRKEQYIKELKKELNKIRRTDPDPETLKQLRECEDQLALFREQVRQFSQDFQAERADKERAESKASGLENEVMSLREKLSQQRHMTSRGQQSYDPSPRTVPLMTATVADGHTCRENAAQALRSRGCAEEARFPSNIGLGHQLEVDGPVNDLGDFAFTSEPRDTGFQNGGLDYADGACMFDGNFALSSEQDFLNRDNSGGMCQADGAAVYDEKLRCPKCWKEYRPEQHLELLEHIDICCD